MPITIVRCRTSSRLAHRARRRRKRDDGHGDRPYYTRCAGGRLTSGRWRGLVAALLISGGERMRLAVVPRQCRSHRTQPVRVTRSGSPRSMTPGVVPGPGSAAPDPPPSRRASRTARARSWSRGTRPAQPAAARRGSATLSWTANTGSPRRQAVGNSTVFVGAGIHPVSRTTRTATTAARGRRRSASRSGRRRSPTSCVRRLSPTASS